MRNLIGVLLLITILFVLFSCKKDKQPNDDNTIIDKDNGVFIINEGNYMWSNASVSYYNFNSGNFYEDIFKNANNRPLGDVAQSIMVLNGKAFIVVNNSGKIEVVDLQDFSSIGVISGLTSPRYMLSVNNSKAYVSDLYSNNIAIVDLNSFSITGNITCKGSTEEMILAGNEVVVTNTRNDKVYFIDTATDRLVDSLKVGFASNSLALDKNNKLWVLCAGDVNNSIKARLLRINVTSRQIEKDYTLNASLDIWDKMRINPLLDTLYYLNEGLYKMPVDADQIPATPFIQQGNAEFHSFSINPVNNNIFIADAMDYIQKGKVNYYNSSGTLLGTIPAGVIPVDFYFK